MRRAGSLYHQIPDFENLRIAFWKAAGGKQDRKDVVTFRKNFEENIQHLRDQLQQRKPFLGDYRFFQVFDPKRRMICAASFSERVVHHAIMNICEPVLESFSIYDSYACRKGKGNREAISRAQKHSRTYGWFLKLDIRKYFDSIDHEILMMQLSRRFKDKDLLLLFQKILDTYHISPGKGVPIGSLISQHLANLYLGSFDHWIKEERKVKAYLRYMDDFLLFGHDKAYLKIELDRIRAFLTRSLSLELKKNVQLNRSVHGIPFLGYRIFPGTIQLSPGSRDRFVHKFRRYEKKWRDGEWSQQNLVCHMEPLIEFTQAANANSFRQGVIERFGVSS